VLSASQDQWQEIMDGIRSQLAKQVPLMNAMKPEEQKHFIEAVNNARWGEENVACFDAEIRNRIEKAERTFS
jgi:hypothetical protein